MSTGLRGKPRHARKGSLDAHDLERSHIEPIEGTRAISIYKHAFLPSVIGDAEMFRTSVDRSRVYFTDRFVERVKRLNKTDRIVSSAYNVVPYDHDPRALRITPQLRSGWLRARVAVLQPRPGRLVSHVAALQPRPGWRSLHLHRSPTTVLIGHHTSPESSNCAPVDS